MTTGNRHRRQQKIALTSYNSGIIELHKKKWFQRQVLAILGLFIIFQILSPFGSFFTKEKVNASGYTSSVTTISAGSDYSLALFYNGTVMSWGENNLGQLCNGTTVDSTSPVNVTGLTNVKAIATGDSHSLALLNDGTIMAWGSGAYGQLGDGERSNSNVPVKVSSTNFPTGTTVEAISAAGRYSLALLSDGSVWAWGYNSYSGLDFTAQSNVPAKIPSLTGVTEISAGLYHVLVLLNDGTVEALGYNVAGQLGNGTTVSSTVPVVVTGLTNVQTIIAGYKTSYAILNDGTVKGWGDNTYHELNDGTTTNQTSPVAVLGLANIKTIATSVASFGLGHSLALLNDGTVKAWGKNIYGVLGDGTAVDTDGTTPVTVSGLASVSAIATGPTHSLAFSDDGNGTIMAWGNNDLGQLGNGTTAMSYLPTPVIFPTIDTSAYDITSSKKTFSKDGVNLTFNGQVTNNFNITVTTEDTSTNSAPQGKAFVKVYTITPSTTATGFPVATTLAYPDGKTYKSGDTVMYWDSTSKTWSSNGITDVTSTVGSSTISFTTSHFTEFAIMTTDSTAAGAVAVITNTASTLPVTGGTMLNVFLNFLLSIITFGGCLILQKRLKKLKKS